MYISANMFISLSISYACNSFFFDFKKIKITIENLKIAIKGNYCKTLVKMYDKVYYVEDE